MAQRAIVGGEAAPRRRRTHEIAPGLQNHGEETRRRLVALGRIRRQAPQHQKFHDLADRARAAHGLQRVERRVPARVGYGERIADQRLDETFLRAEIIVERRGVLLPGGGDDVAHRDASTPFSANN